MLENLTRKLISKPKLVILISALLMLPSLVGFLLTGVNYNLLSYLPEELDSVQGEATLDKTFGCASMSFLIVDGMMTDDVSILKEHILAIDCVEAVLGIDDVLGSGVPISMLPEEITSILYSGDGSSTIILVQFSTASADSRTLSAIEEVGKIAGRDCFMSGLSAILADTKALVERQAPGYIACAILCALVVLTILSESWFMPLIVLYTICIAVVYNMGTNIIFGEISYLTECIAVVLQLAVTMDYSVFLVERFKEELEKGLSKEDAIVNAVKESISSLLGSSVTTVFGFGALCFMSLTIGLDIGLVMVKGVIFGMLSVIFIMPSLLVQFNKPLTKYTHRYLNPSFNKLNTFLIKRRKLACVVFVVLLIPAYFMQANVKSYYSLDEMLGSGRPSIVALNKLKEDFGMASVNFAVVDDELSHKQMNRLIEKVEKVEGIKTVIAYNKYIGPALPETMIPHSILSIVKNDGKQLMLLISEYTAGHEDCGKQIEALTEIFKSYDQNSYLTGEGPLTKDLVEIADNDFKVTTILSIAAILVIIALFQQSLTIPFILVTAIELAIMINTGVSLLTGSSQPFIAPAVIGCVQLGATVDYAILLTNRYNRELHNGHNRKKAMLIAANASDVSIFKSMCVFFAATIIVYFVSDVDIVKDLCLLLSRGSVISGTVIILFLTPLLVTFEKTIFRTTVGWRDSSQKVTDTTEDGSPESTAEANSTSGDENEYGSQPIALKPSYPNIIQAPYELIPNSPPPAAAPEPKFSVDTQEISLDDCFDEYQKKFESEMSAIERATQTVRLPDRDEIIRTQEHERLTHEELP